MNRTTRLRPHFSGTGGCLLRALFVGYLLCLVTLGIYRFWLLADLARFHINNAVIVDTGERAGENMPRAIVVRR